MKAIARLNAIYLSSNVNEVSCDKILHHLMLIKYRTMIFLHRLLYFVLSLLLFITNFETNSLPQFCALTYIVKAFPKILTNIELPSQNTTFLKLSNGVLYFHISYLLVGFSFVAVHLFSTSIWVSRGGHTHAHAYCMLLKIYFT